MTETESIGVALLSVLVLTVLVDLFYATVKPPKSRLLRRVYSFGWDVGLQCLIWISCLLLFAFLLRIF